MRCIKCGYISFDFNQVCPKCNRGLYDEQRQLNLPSFRPDPPMLLGRLIGEPFDADIDISPDQTAVFEDGGEGVYSGIEDSLHSLSEEEDLLGEEEELDVISFEPDDHGPSTLLEPAEPEDKELVLDLEDISMEDTKDPVSTRHKDEEKEDISFSLDDISFEDLEIDGEGAPDLGVNMPDKTTENAAVAEFDPFKDNEAIDALYFDSNAEGLTKEIDMKKFRKEGGKGDDKAE